MPRRWPGGPGAIYVGDLSQLVGPATDPPLGGIDEEGNPDGSVPLESLERHIWIYESPYYQDLIEKANLLNPTPLTSSGEEFEFQYACTNRAFAAMPTDGALSHSQRGGTHQ